MKVQIYDRIQTIVEVQSDFRDRMIPQGTSGTVIEGYEQPEGYAVDLAIPDTTLIGEFDYENVILGPEQFIVITQNDVGQIPGLVSKS